MVGMLHGMRKVVFLADEFYLNRYLNGLIRRYIKETYPDLEYEWLVGNERNSDLMQQYLNDQDPSVGLLLSTWFYERVNVHGFPMLISGDARMISAAKRPVFALRSAYLSNGIDGGYFPRASADSGWPSCMPSIKCWTAYLCVRFLSRTQQRHPYRQLSQARSGWDPSRQMPREYGVSR